MPATSDVQRPPSTNRPRGPRPSSNLVSGEGKLAETRPKARAAHELGALSGTVRTSSTTTTTTTSGLASRQTSGSWPQRCQFASRPILALAEGPPSACGCGAHKRAEFEIIVVVNQQEVAGRFTWPRGPTTEFRPAAQNKCPALIRFRKSPLGPQSGLGPGQRPEACERRNLGSRRKWRTHPPVERTASVSGASVSLHSGRAAPTCRPDRKPVPFIAHVVRSVNQPVTERRTFSMPGSNAAQIAHLQLVDRSRGRQLRDRVEWIAPTNFRISASYEP